MTRITHISKDYNAPVYCGRDEDGPLDKDTESWITLNLIPGFNVKYCPKCLEHPEVGMHLLKEVEL